jgi:hypothetical protein
MKPPIVDAGYTARVVPLCDIKFILIAQYVDLIVRNLAHTIPA